MAPRFVDIGCLHDGKFLIYPLERIALRPGEDIIIGRGKDNCDINLFPKYLEQALSTSKTTLPREEGCAVSQEPSGIDDAELGKRTGYYGSCSRRHLAYSTGRRCIMDLRSRNGTFLARAVRDKQGNPTGKYEERIKLPPGKYFGVEDGDIIYAGGVALRFEDRRD